MNDTVVDLNVAMETFVAENAKFVAGNKSAGTRARKALQEVIKLSKTRRVEIQAVKNAEKK